MLSKLPCESTAWALLKTRLCHFGISGVLSVNAVSFWPESARDACRLPIRHRSWRAGTLSAKHRLEASDLFADDNWNTLQNR